MGIIDDRAASPQESGQVAVFSMYGLLLLFLGVVLIGQMAIHTYRVCHAQAVADFSAMSGAVTQAATLNRIARVNEEIVEAYEELEEVCGSTVFSSRGAALQYIQGYEETVQGYKETIQDLSASGAGEALRNAALVVLLNSEAEAEFEYLGTSDLAQEVLPSSFSRWEERTIVFYYIAGDTVVSESRSVPCWVVKRQGTLVAFAAGSRWGTAPGYDGEGLLGPLPGVKTAAQAKPFGGQIYEPDPTYQAKLIQLKTPKSPFLRRFGGKALDYEH